MEFSPTQFSLEIALILGGAWVLWRSLSTAAGRTNWFGNNRLAPWDVTIPEVIVLAVMIFLCGMTIQLATTQLYYALAPPPEPTRTGEHSLTAVEMTLYGLGFHLGGLLAWPLFGRFRRGAFADYGMMPPPSVTAPRLPPLKLIVAAATTVLAAFPVLTILSFLWTNLLTALGLPVDVQPFVGALAEVKSPALFAGMILVACVLAPVNEELLFRRTIFHFLRQRTGRLPALLVSGLLFGAIHGHLAGLPLLSVLGIALAVAYEKTGDIRVPMLAHGLFNLQTVCFVLLGATS